MSAPLPSPIREALREPFTDGDVARHWSAIEQRRASPRVRAPWLALAAACALALVLLAARARPPAPGPLLLADGTSVPALDARTEARAVDLSDRSRITLSAGAALVPVHNSARVFATELRHGRARFDVQPRGPRRWSIDCGLATVRVVGTSFVLDRDPSHLHVAVLHGVVRVEGARVPNGLRELHDGERLDVFAAPPPVVTAPVAPSPQPAAPPPATPPARAARVATSDAWRALARAHDYNAAWTALGPDGPTARATTADADDLLALGEVAHRSRHYADASSLYARFVDRYTAHPEAGMVAFTLGRLQLDQLGAPREAARWFERAQSLGVARYLREDLSARLVEAHARAGNTDGARDAAEEYLRQFPEGRRAEDVRRWVH